MFALNQKYYGKRDAKSVEKGCGQRIRDMASGNCFGKNVCNDLNVCIPVQNNQTMPLPKLLSSMQQGVPSKVQELLDKVK